MNFIKESIEEFRKVTWPTRNQALTLSVIVLIFTIVSTLVFLGSDRLFRAGYDALLETSTKVQNQQPIDVDIQDVDTTPTASPIGGATIKAEGPDGEPVDVQVNATPVTE